MTEPDMSEFLEDLHDAELTGDVTSAMESSENPDAAVKAVLGPLIKSIKKRVNEDGFIGGDILSVTEMTSRMIQQKFGLDETLMNSLLHDVNNEVMEELARLVVAPSSARTVIEARNARRNELIEEGVRTGRLKVTGALPDSTLQSSAAPRGPHPDSPA